jgi:hypothetical protein
VIIAASQGLMLSGPRPLSSDLNRRLLKGMVGGKKPWVQCPVPRDDQQHTKIVTRRVI